MMNSIMYEHNAGLKDSLDAEFGSLLTEQRDRLRSLHRRSGEGPSGEYRTREQDVNQSDSDSEERRNRKPS